MRFIAFAAVMFFGIWGRSQTPSSYPYFNRIHLASDSTHPSYYHFYAGGVKLSEDTVLLLGQQFLGGNDQIYQRTLEFININTGELLEKRIEPNVALMGIDNPPFSSGFVGDHFIDMGMQYTVVRTLRKYTNVQQGISTEFEIDAYPSIDQPDFYRGFSIMNNSHVLFYGSSPNNKTLISIYDTTGFLVFKSDLTNIISNIATNQGSVVQTQQLLNHSFLLQTRRPISPNSWVGNMILLNEDFTWKKSLLSINQRTSSNFFQHSDSSIYLFGLTDTSNSPNNPNYNSYIFKYDQDGNLLWKKNYPIEQIQLQGLRSSLLVVAKELESGNLLFIGNDVFKGTDGDYQQIDGDQSVQTRLLCIDPNGEKIWERSFHTSSENSTFAIGCIPLPNDDVVIYGGIIEDFFFYEKAFVAKVNCLGRMTDMMHNVQTNEQDGLVSVQIEADSFFETTINWGDGTPSTTFQTAYSDSSELFLAQHQYAQSKPYQMTVSTRGCKDTLVYELIQEAHVPDNNEAELNMYPNPTFHSFTIHLPTNELLDIQITDEFGRLVANYKQVSAFNGFEVDLNAELAGK
jgi:hypothetical protein